MIHENSDIEETKLYKSTTLAAVYKAIYGYKNTLILFSQVDKVILNNHVNLTELDTLP